MTASLDQPGLLESESGHNVRTSSHSAMMETRRPTAQAGGWLSEACHLWTRPAHAPEGAAESLPTERLR